MSKAHIAIICAIGLSAGPFATCIAQQPHGMAADGMAAFAELSPARQKKLVKEMRLAADAIEHVAFDAQRELLAQLRKAKLANQKSKLGKTKESKKPAPKAPASWQLPAVVTYRYGLARIEPVLRTGGRNALKAAELRVPTELLLLGMLPDADLVVAELQRQMDGDRSADPFMRFLELWRNGDESFYQALDRTAGTQDSVFFYDVMLGDYVKSFGKGKSAAAKHLASSLDAAHDALHDSFLSYRQYRAFREAVALSLVLPPDVQLPARLRRYETAAEGLYSLRDQVQMVLAANDHDPRAVTTLVRETAPPLPDPLWSSSYNPYDGWTKVFQRAMPKMIADSGSTDAFLAKASKQATERATTVRNAARAALGLPTGEPRHLGGAAPQ
ncbi:MAG: hypothetical protein ACE37K_14335 [Planctomycetota bacterium]